MIEQVFIPEILDEAVPGIAQLLFDASDDQIDEMLNRLAVRNEELLEKARGQAESGNHAKDYAERLIDHFEFWFGKLDRAQVVLVEEHVRQLEFVGFERTEARKRWQTEFSRLLSERKDPARFETDLKALILDPEKERTNRYRELLDNNETVILRMTEKLALGMTESQRKFLDAKVNRIAGDLEALACDNASAPTTFPPPESYPGAGTYLTIPRGRDRGAFGARRDAVWCSRRYMSEPQQSQGPKASGPQGLRPL
jgi:hypothetical protein